MEISWNFVGPKKWEPWSVHRWWGGELNLSSGDLCPEVSLSGGDCPGASLSRRGLCPGRSLCRGVSVKEGTLSRETH